ncbi:MFS transporter (plasmid) [Azospirillum baldaniorum]|uniref:Major facilitator superfamily MFS-1 n=1 Tax=Azospirillum baldaniorum TaxID=1064539 RepID=A0A9P1JUD1_9PROT|nr:MFS transporter [Azospirillum baldaniorum]AWJ91574.1 MFS transporter [Azospirillum baldaniorum]TWA83562.1 putative MFS family arabinose efflux permease [Azospirillum brasilense]CCC99893.1 major facilitator superfamily MFS-1 [Azospirillum baldaniorum]
MRLLILMLGLAGFASAFSLRTTDPMLTVIASDLGIGVAEAALLSSAYTLPYAAMQLILGPVGDAIGKTRLIRLSLVVLTIGVALSAVAPGYYTVLASRMLAGAFAGGIIPASMALIGDRVVYTERQFAISRFLLAVILGQMSGSAVAGALSEVAGWRTVFALAAVVTGLIALTAALLLKGEREERHPLSMADARARYASVLANPVSVWVFATVAAEGLLIFGVFPFVAPMLSRHGAEGAFEAGVTLAAFAIGGVVYSFIVRRLLGTLGQWGMMGAGGLVAGGSYLAMLAPVPWPVVSLLFLVAGFGFYMLHNTMQTQATELSATARGSALALFASSFFLGQGIGPVVYGAVADRVGLPALFLFGGVLTMLLGVGAVRLIRRPA